MNRAAVLTEYDAPLEIQEIEPRTPTADGIVVDTEACGICRSDWHGWKGHWEGTPPLGHVLGHEPAGRVVEVGDEVEEFREGDRVAVPFINACGSCPHCWSNHSHLCDDGLSLGFSPELPGAFATEFALPNADFNAMHLPDGAEPVEVAALGCRFATAFHGLSHRADVEPGSWVAVHGCGGIGLSAVHVADAIGARVVAVDLNEDALAMAEELGADATVSAGEVDVVEEVHAITDGGASVSVDALGIEETCTNSIACLGLVGQHVQIGMTTGDGTLPVDVDNIVNRELEIYGVKGMPPSRYGEILELTAAGDLDPGKLVSQTVPIERVSERIAAMDDFGTVGIEVVDEF